MEMAGGYRQGRERVGFNFDIPLKVDCRWRVELLPISYKLSLHNARALSTYLSAPWDMAIAQMMVADLTCVLLSPFLFTSL
jgi:hypothetical protein